jgi:lysyl-tRNA synthetase class 2
MSDWKPASDADAAKRRAAMLRRIRNYLESEQVLEVDTPALSFAAGSEPNIESLVVRSELSPDRRLFLHTSPEFFMKRLLAAGYPDIYSVCRVFRDGEVGRRHQPEFTMLEWYRLGFGLSDIIEDTCLLISNALQLADPSVDRLDYAEAFRQYAALDPIHASIDELASCVHADEDLRRSLGDDRGAWLDLVLSVKVVAKFASDRLTVIAHYPASQAALARLCPADQQVADRFEVFFGEEELANGYVELTDVDEQKRRMEDEVARREKSGKAVNPIDTSLLAALQSGLPQCAGVAVGVERLQMAFDRADDIANVVTFVFGQEND